MDIGSASFMWELDREHHLIMATKRKIARATSPIRPPSAKKPRQTELISDSFDHSRDEEKYGIVQREFYPAEMSNERCKQYNDNELPRPIEVLNRILESSKEMRTYQIEGGGAVVHWFKRDLRLTDNRALSMASEKAKKEGVPLICMFIVSPQDYQAHFTSPARVDFELRSLKIMQEDLSAKDIPLYITTIEQKKDVPSHMLEKFQEWGARHVYCNIEYEVDELRRETKLVRQCLWKTISFEAVHDDVVVPPGILMSGAGKQYSVYSPWLKAWIRHIHEHPHVLEASEPPAQNPPNARIRFASIFDMPIPSAPPNKSLTQEERDRFAHLWPAGEHEGLARLKRFLDEKVGKYKDARNFPASNSTAMMSVHFSAGTLAARTAVRSARDANTVQRLDAGISGITGWISELAWRDFYKHVLANWPYVCMYKPFKYEYTDIRWEYNEEQFKRWCEGRTGFPIVDAAMRQLNNMAYMHNRCRMITASFLAKDLLLDWRMGEKYFMEHLVDGDFASNNGGWGFSASTGVDPQPYFRIFNPLLQSEKFDEKGEYIRKWVPELAGVEGKAIHDPYGRGVGKQAEKAGYPKPMVEHKASRERALERYKEGLGRGTANFGGGVHN
ncbi:DNA photolyase phr1 [Elasticomyces elasticus]|nr:DNA photolyase phr1 [Elasticomyces elasticus]KAK3668957.1 DNA photolyase phr1 [Elasticomyces elasticus]KAK4914706.1 DNA photolyase phr1 [Elasticomyces elasticus]KAK5759201.1 DNA photolyase phr1 [Elasticomyces elasticus]